MNKYKDGKIYKIICDKSDLIYIGSTIRSLKDRFSAHDSDTKKTRKNQTCSKYLFKLGECNIVLIEEYSCNNKTELHIREQYWMDIYKEKGVKLINKKRAYVSQSLEEKKEHARQYFQKNKERIRIRDNNKNRKEYMREWAHWRDLWKNKKRQVLICDYIEMLNLY